MASKVKCRFSQVRCEELIVSKDSHRQNQNALLNELKKLLLDGYDPGRILTQYSSEVMKAFENPGRLIFLNIDDVLNDSAFDHWDRNPESCIMLLRGSTVVTNVDYSWLSPVIFHLIGRYHAQGRTVVFNCCHTRLHMDKDTPIHAVISSLVYQLLEAKKSVLQDRSRFQELKQNFSDSQWQANRPELPFAILHELLNAFQEVYILLDRVDRIKGDADRFMKHLLVLIEKCNCKIKVFLVASSTPHNLSGLKWTRAIVENAKEEIGPERFVSLTLDQQ